MRTKVFISKQNEGWSEFRIPEEFEQYSYEKLVKTIHRLVQRNKYKGLLITENPSPFSAL
ncbi:MAG: hypothetical protein JXB24_08615 [Bacteroidales bacterium]|jgi:hypothetical protein|nr:hypothetical protein [Bacteroidales bacterium]